MAYRRKTVRLVGGSLNLRLDTSETPEQHSLELTNCRPDKIGQVVARRGAQAVITALANLDVHTLAKRPGGTGLYIGANSAVYRNNGGGGALFSGFDGNPLGMASQGGWIWIANRNAMKKDNGSAIYNWLPAAPGTAPTVAAGSQDSKNFATFALAEAWDVYDDENVEVLKATPSAAKYPNAGADPPAFYDSATKVNPASDSLRLRPTYTGNWVAQRTFASAQDFSIDSQQRDSDRIRFHLVTVDPDAIDSISLSIDVANGDFTTDYYTVDIPQAKIRQSRLTWIPIDVVRKFGSSRQLLLDDPEYVTTQQAIQAVRDRIAAGDGMATDEFELARLEDELQRIRDRVLAETAGFRRVGNNAAKDWTTVKALRVTCRINRPTYVWFDEWSIFGGVGASLEGTVYYRVTFDTAAGHESNPSPISTGVTLSRTGINLSVIPTSGDAQVTKRHIYRGGGTLGNFHRVHTINDNSTTTWADTVEEDVAVDGPVLETDHQVPENCRGVIGPFFGRLILFSSAANPNRYWWTDVNLPQYVPATNRNDIGDLNAEIYTVTHHGRMLVFYLNNSIHILAGDPDENGQQEQVAEKGPVGPMAVCDAGDVDYFVASDGVYRFNLNRLENVSGAIAPIFRNEYAEIGPSVSIPPMTTNATNRLKVVCCYADGFVRVSYPEDGQSSNNVELVLHVETGQWSQNRWNLTAGGWRTLFYDQSNGELYGGQPNGRFYRLEDGANDGGSAIPVEWQSGYFDQGEPDREKVYEDLTLEYDTGGANVTLKAFWDDGGSETTIGTLNASSRTRKVFPINSGDGKRARNIAVRTEGNITAGLGIYDISLHYYAQPRRSRSFDSDLIDFGSRRAKRFWAFEVDIEVEDTNGLTWELLSDIPDRKIAQRATATKTIASTGRHRLFIQPGSTVFGSLFQLRLSRTTEFYLHAARLAILPYGVHVDGGAGETWETEPMGLAS